MPQTETKGGVKWNFVSLASAPTEAESYSTTQKLSCPMTWEPWQRLFAKKLAYYRPVATTISWFTARAVPDSARSGISPFAESKPQGPSRKGGSVQARCRESGGAHGLRTIGAVPVKKPRRCFGADSMQFLLHALRTRHQSKHCLRKAMAPTAASSPSSTGNLSRFRFRVVQSK